MNSFLSRISRTTACISLLLTGQCLPAQPAPVGKNFSRESMLRALAQKVITPGYTMIAANSRALAEDIEKFNSTPDPAALGRVRADWNAAFAAAESLRCFQTGPIADRQVASTFYFWQVLPNRIEAIVKDSSQTID